MENESINFANWIVKSKYVIATYGSCWVDKKNIDDINIKFFSSKDLYDIYINEKFKNSIMKINGGTEV